MARGRDAQLRPARLEAARLREANEWMERYRRFWEESFGRLDELLEAEQRRQKKEKRDGRSG